MLELVDRLVSEASARKLGRESPSLSRGTLRKLSVNIITARQVSLL